MSLFQIQARSNNFLHSLLCQNIQQNFALWLIILYIYHCYYVIDFVVVDLLILNFLWTIKIDALFNYLFQSEYRTCQTRHNRYCILSDSLSCDWKADFLIIFFAHDLFLVCTYDLYFKINSNLSRFSCDFKRIIYCLVLLWPSKRSVTQ